MEVTKKHPTIGKYILLKTLGTGYNSKVKLGLDPLTNQFCAVKIIKHSHPSLNLKNLQKEIAVLSALNHPHIVNLIEYIENGEYQKKKGGRYNALAIIMELVPGGELFEYVAISRFSDKIARTYFHQLINTLEYCHGQGITHRDLKPENLLFDQNFNLKVADFGFATLILGNNNDGQLYTILGTPSYMAPELHLEQPYSGPAVDLFASAIILFIMYAGTPPFVQADPKDPHYKLLCINKHETFWASHSRGKPLGFFTPEFKNLMNLMLALDPSQRLSIAEIKSHKWYNGETVDVRNIQEEFIQRKKIIDMELKKQREARQKQKELEKANINEGKYLDNKGYRGNDLESEMMAVISQAKLAIDIKLTNKRVLKDYEMNAPYKIHTEIFLVINPEILFKYLLVLSQGVFNGITVSDDSYKIKGKYTGNFHKIEVWIEIVRKDEETCVVEFKKRSGDTIEFLKVIEEHFRKRINNLLAKIKTDEKKSS